jgi:hypothetical protein
MTTKLALPLTLLGTFASGLSGHALVRLGMNPTGHSFEYVARANQSGNSASLYGYLTHINGLDDAELFTPPAIPGTPPSEANARFTVVTQLTFTTRFVNANLVIGSEDETMTIYFDQFPQVRDFANPATFATGTAVATFRNRVQTILNVQVPLSAESPGRAIIQGDTESTQEGATDFTFGNKRYVIGQSGRGLHLFATGEGTLTSTNPFAAVFVFGGYAEEAGGPGLPH